MKNAYRSVQIDSLEELDTNNFGLHFTANPNYQHNGGGSNGATPNKKYTAKIEVSGKFEVCEDATAESNFNHPKEKEVVLMPSQILSGKLVIIDNATCKFSYEGKYWGHQGQDITINTGTRCDQWVLEFI
jgi:hypothetical protein